MYLPHGGLRSFLKDTIADSTSTEDGLCVQRWKTWDLWLHLACWHWKNAASDVVLLRRRRFYPFTFRFVLSIQSHRVNWGGGTLIDTWPTQKRMFCCRSVRILGMWCAKLGVAEVTNGSQVGVQRGQGRAGFCWAPRKYVYIYIYMLDILLIPMRLSNKNAQWPQLFCRACHTDLLARWDYKRWLYRRWLCALWLSGAVASQGLRVANWARIQGNQWKYLPNHSSGHEKTGIIHWKTMIN